MKRIFTFPIARPDIRRNFHGALRAASALALLGFAAGCARTPKPIESAAAEVVLDYRNGWYHWASGRESISDIARNYGRDASLVAELNRAAEAQVPPAGAAVYVPPIHDRAEMREVLERINRDPRIVPKIPPKPEILSSLRPDAPAASRETASGGRGKGETDGLIPLADEEGPAPAGTSGVPPPPPDEPLRVSRAAFIEPASGGRLLPASGASGGEWRKPHLEWPVKGTVLQEFGGGASFDGIAIAAADRALVEAAADGKVAYAGDLKGYGKVVIVEHAGGFKTVYGYGDQLLVSKNQKVRTGQKIAMAGRPAKNSRSQVFFQVRHGARTVDPMEYLP